jgi:hypothetical protein
VAKKDTQSVVLSMLSDAGSKVRPTDDDAAATPAPPAPAAIEPVTPEPAAGPPPTHVPKAVAPAAARSSSRVQSVMAAPDTADADDTAPRTLRLRASTASALRSAWLEAKRDDVLLTAQDFASTIIDEALRVRTRTSRARRSPLAGEG